MSTMATNGSSFLLDSVTSMYNHSFNNSPIVDFGNSTSDLKRLSDLGEWCKYITPLWIILGIPGNILAGFLWFQRQMRPSSGIFLAVLALDELIFLILLMIMELHNKWSTGILNYPVLCEIFPVIFLTTQQLSPLLVLGFTIQRYIAICHPFLKEKFCTTRRSLISIGILVAFDICVNVVQAYFYLYDKELQECGAREEAVEGLTSAWAIHSWITELALFGVVPLTIFVLNVMVICETKRLSKAEEALTLKYHHTTSNVNHRQLKQPNKSISNDNNNNSKSTNNNNVKRFPSKQDSMVNGNHQMSVNSASNSNRPSATTFTLLAVSTYLIITVLPVTIFYVLSPAFPEGDKNMTREQQIHDEKWKTFFRFDSIRNVIDEIGKTHYALNFYIYLITGNQFRRQLKLMLVKIFCRGGMGRSFSNFRSSHLSSSSTAGGGGGGGGGYNQQTSVGSNKRMLPTSPASPGTTAYDKTVPLLNASKN